ncbi:MAG: Gfo/Idh/MocA family protein, partial [Flavobacteriales bacterium]
MKNVNFGVIGAGHIGKRHMEMVRRKEGFELVAIADVRSKEECGVESDVSHYSDHNAMLKAHPELDVVCVCTPNGFHAQQAIDSISANCHV